MYYPFAWIDIDGTSNAPSISSIHAKDELRCGDVSHWDSDIACLLWPGTTGQQSVMVAGDANGLTSYKFFF